jgi:hypothetical protein
MINQTPLRDALTARTHATRPLVEHVADEIGTGEFGEVPCRFEHGDAFVSEHQVAELVGQGPVPGGQALLNQEDVTVGVLTPLTTHSRRQVRHLELDRSTAAIRHRLHEPCERYFAAPGREVEDLTDGAGDTTAGWHAIPLSMNPLSLSFRTEADDSHQPMKRAVPLALTMSPARACR